MPGDYIMLAVTDTGVGMAPEAVDAAFDPLFTTKADGHNTGLGLSMVYGFAKQSRGHAKIDSEVGHGTTVRLYLPRSASNTADERGRDALPPLMQTGSEAVLLVEDNADVRSLSLRHLTELGYRVHAAETGAAAVAALEGPEPFDLLFTDIVMPGGMTGYGVADIAVARRPGIKVLFATGYAGPGTAHGQQRHPDAPMLSKPFRKQELAEAVRMALDAR
jgi:CheY-like chemotaxis protein